MSSKSKKHKINNPKLNTKLKLFFDTVSNMSKKYHEETDNKKEKLEKINKKWVSRMDGILYCHLATKGFNKKHNKKNGGDSNDQEKMCGFCYGETELIDLHTSSDNIHHFFHVDCLNRYYKGQIQNNNSNNVREGDKIFCICCSTYIEYDNYNIPDQTTEPINEEQFNLENALRVNIEALQNQLDDLRPVRQINNQIQSSIFNISEEDLQTIYTMFMRLRPSNIFFYFNPIYRARHNIDFINILESGYVNILDVVRNTYNEEIVNNFLVNEENRITLNRQILVSQIQYQSIQAMGFERAQEYILQGILPSQDIINRDPILQGLFRDLSDYNEEALTHRINIRDRPSIENIRDTLIFDYCIGCFIILSFILILLDPILSPTQNRGGKSKRNRKRKQKRRTQKIHKR
jgi:hypothetical protein